MTAPLSTVGRLLFVLSLGGVSPKEWNLQPAEPVRRHQWARPDDIIQIDTKQLALFERVVHRINGDHPLGSSSGAVYEKAHLTIDDATPLAEVEVHPDENQATTVGFPQRAPAWFDSQA